MAQFRGTSVASLIAEIDNSRSGGLSSAVRLFVLDTLKQEVAACRTKASPLD
ncbi:MAG: ribbon-helix-helix domain-containing protein [Alphaproteobacteria bacterium]